MEKLNKKINLAVLFGGRSLEHEISIISALQMIKALDDTKFNLIPVYINPDGRWFSGLKLLDKTIYKNFKKYEKTLLQVTLLPQPKEIGLTVLSVASKRKIPVDVYYPLFHGENGEDGNLQGLFELAEVPYTGFSVFSSAVSMDKQVAKYVLKSVNVPVLPSEIVSKFDLIADPKDVISRLTNSNELKDFPYFVKPCSRGSSIGISKVKDEKELLKALVNVFKYDLYAIVEPFMGEMFEINMAICGDWQNVATSVVEIPHSDSGVLSYEDKYLRGGAKKTGESQGMASLTRVINPQDLSKEIIKQVDSYARTAFKALKCCGNARIDFMHDNKTGKVYLNEINSPPGSQAFYLWSESEPELLYSDLIEQQVALALKRAEEKASLESFFGFKALK